MKQQSVVEKSSPGATWIIVEDHAGAGILNTMAPQDNFHILSKEELVADPTLRFSTSDRVCINSETVLDEVLQRMDDSARRKTVEQLKNKVSCREMLADVYPGFYFEQIKLHDLPNTHFDPSKKYFVKPIKGYWGSGGRCIEEGVDLTNLVADISEELERKVGIFSDKVLSKEDFLIEEFLEGEEYAVDMFYSSSGEPVLTNICHHPIPSKKAYLHVVYYTTAELFASLYETFVDFFAHLNDTLQARSLPIHGEFKYHNGELIPVELNPLRYGSDGFSDLSFHGFGFNPFLCLANDEKPDWQELWKDKAHKVYAFYLGYIGTDIDVTNYRPNFFEFRQLFSHILSDIALNYEKQLAFSVIYIEEESIDKIYELLEVEFQDYFLSKKKYSDKSFQELHRAGIEVHLHQGDVLWHEDDLGDYLLLILDGTLEVSTQSTSGEKIILDTISEGAIVGELSALDGLPRSATVLAETDCVCMRISANSFRQLIRKVPDVLEDLFWQQVARVRDFNRRIAG